VQARALLAEQVLSPPLWAVAAGAYHVRAMAEQYGVPVILHTDHCAKNLLPWLDGMLAASERCHAAQREPTGSGPRRILAGALVIGTMRRTASPSSRRT